MVLTGTFRTIIESRLTARRGVWVAIDLPV
jgi:hypothetical protein